MRSGRRLIPPARRGGRRRRVDVRAVLDGILYVLESGCQWRHLPKDLPPRSTCHAYLQLWAWDGTLERIPYQLYQRARSEEHTSELQSQSNLVCRLLLEKKKIKNTKF